MNWKDYKRIYQDYEMSVHQARLISYISTEVIKDFPYDISGYYDISAFPKLRQASKLLQEIVKDFKNGRVHKKETRETIEKDDSLTDLMEAIFYLFGLMVKRHMFTEELEFQRILNFQELIIHHSNFDGFLSDSVRAICYTCPNVMKKSKTIQWEEILSCKGWSELMTRLVEIFVRDLGWKPLEKRLNMFTGLFKLKLKFDEGDIQTIKELDITRNLIVHNGGRVNQEYVKLKRTTDIKMGDYVSVNNGILRHISKTLQLVASDIFVEVSKKYFRRRLQEILSATGRRR